MTNSYKGQQRTISKGDRGKRMGPAYRDALLICDCCCAETDSHVDWPSSFIAPLFMCMGVLPTCTSVYHKWAVPVEARMGVLDPLVIDCLSCHVGTGIKLGPLNKQPVILITEPPLQHGLNFKGKIWSLHFQKMILLFFKICGCLYVCMWIICTVIQMFKEASDSPRAGVAGSCKLLDMVVGTQQGSSEERASTSHLFGSKVWIF